MHVLHIYAVEAETKDDAIRAAENFANNETWSDWNQVGGRWDDELPDDCVAFSENEDLCRATIVKMKKRTEDVVGEVIREYGNITIFSEDPQWFFGRAETKPNQQFLVAVDLHF